MNKLGTPEEIVAMCVLILLVLVGILWLGNNFNHCRRAGHTQTDCLLKFGE